MFCRHVFEDISGGIRGISRFLGNFAGPRLREISEALFLSPQLVYIFSIFTLTLVLPQQHRLHSGRSRGGARGGQAQGDCPPPPPLLSQGLDPAAATGMQSTGQD